MVNMERLLILAALIAGNLLCIEAQVAHCEAWEWRCTNGDCIKRRLRCDSKPHCDDASDEVRCPSPLPSAGPDGGCPADHLKCSNGECYSRVWHCDGTADCDDGTDEHDCSFVGHALMSSTAVVGMSVAVGSLFILMIIVTAAMTCRRRKQQLYACQARHQRVTAYPSSIPCPTLSGAIVMREPPPQYTAHPDMYYSRPAEVNLAFVPDDGVIRPPPCYTSQPNLHTAPSNLSLSSSVEAPPSYCSENPQQNELNMTFNSFSLHPDDSGGHGLRDTCSSMFALNNSTFSALSKKSWADNLDGPVFELGSNNELSGDCGNVRTNSLLKLAEPETVSHPVAQSRCENSTRYIPNRKASSEHQSKHAVMCKERARALGSGFFSTPILFEETQSSARQEPRSTQGSVQCLKTDNVTNKNRNLSKSACNLGLHSHLEQQPSTYRQASGSTEQFAPKTVEGSDYSDSLQFWRNTNLILGRTVSKEL